MKVVVSNEWVLEKLGDRGFSLHPREEIFSPALNKDILHIWSFLSQNLPEGIAAVAPAATSLLLVSNLNSPVPDLQSLADQLQKNWKHARHAPLPAAVTHQIPVNYGGSEGPDLDTIARQLKIPPKEFVKLHASQLYQVFFMGFSFGFPYMGPLPRALQIARKSIPLKQVPPGTLAIAGTYTGIYPRALPGGWHLIGKVQVSLVQEKSEKCLFSPGDQVQFIPG